MKTTNKTLEQQLSEVEKKALDLRKKIQAKIYANKPKSIMDRVKTLKDVFKIAKPEKEELAILNYKGRSKRLLFSKRVMIISLIAEVLNEGHVFTMKPDENRHYPYFVVSSGFVFYRTDCADSDALSASAARLCFKSDELARYAGKTFLKEYKDAVM